MPIVQDRDERHRRCSGREPLLPLLGEGPIKGGVTTSSFFGDGDFAVSWLLGYARPPREGVCIGPNLCRGE